jgi:hypothetical protein
MEHFDHCSNCFFFKCHSSPLSIEMSINYSGWLFRIVFSLYGLVRRRFISAFFFYWGNAKAM